MNSKSGNDKFDIVSEAEAVLAAYTERCKIHVVKAKKRQKSGARAALVACAFFLLLGIAVCLYLHLAI